jgi:GcrA cell cycle regulator
MTATNTATDTEPPGSSSPGGGTWTPERVEQLKILTDAGLSCAQVARRLGVSRNAVIGKLNRLGLSRGRPPAGPRAAAAQSAAPRLRRPPIMAQRQILRAVYAEAPPAAEDTVIAGDGRCSLLDLAKGKCRWPISDPGAADFAFCGNAAVHGLPYCPGHARMAYRIPTARPSAINAARM